MAETPLEYVLTRLAGGEAPGAGFAQWEALDCRAAEHRLQPLLHHLHAGAESIPAPIRATWARAHREAAIVALQQRRELLQLAELLERHGLPFLALKGAWLAWHAWPDAALRPLRDLDLWLPGTSALAAREVLLREGWVQEAAQGFDRLGPQQWLARFKALPPLVSPDRVMLDLHARLWDDHGHAKPPEDAMERAVTDADYPALRYPGPVDQLMHLAVHATFHRFDGGPLMLHDFAYLLRRVDFDWPRVWSRAGAESWQLHLALCLAGAREWSGVDAPWPELPVAVPRELVERLPLLLAKPHAAREGDIAAAKAVGGGRGLADRLSRMAARRERYHSLRSYVGWVAQEAAGALRSTLGSRERMATFAALDEYLAR